MSLRLWAVGLAALLFSSFCVDLGAAASSSQPHPAGADAKPKLRAAVGEFPENRDMSTTTQQSETSWKPIKILYIITSLAPFDWNPFGPRKWNYLQEADPTGTKTDMHCIWFARAHKKGDAYNGTYQSQYDPTTGRHDLVKISGIAAWDTVAVQKFVAEHYEEGNTRLVIGTHGQGDWFWILNYTTDGGRTYHQGGSVSVNQVIRENFQGRHFLSTVLDCCLMGELYTMSNFNSITNYVGCGEGFQWGDDWDLNGTMFSATSALAQSNPSINTYNALVATGEHFMQHSPLGRNDFGIYFTPSADALLTHINESPIYHGILKETSEKIARHTPITEKNFNYSFYTVADDDDSSDTQYLVDVWKLALTNPSDTKLVTLFRSVLRWHQGQHCGSGPETPALYNFQLSGLSLTSGHVSNSISPILIRRLTGTAPNETIPVYAIAFIALLALVLVVGLLLGRRQKSMSSMRNLSEASDEGHMMELYVPEAYSNY
ncbi:hypothetical protein AK812_SmicGene8084 [Symbiodinium microadriaticum]|uniref:Uncharacterized protein n=1 Tax=Symbiodinium microadriaticum TaxID=2951 RepID=A0A1Q9ELW8_SYMMI|nr:hypothetical protein AK812_SmicGene8084 [Symbiodinium microadriaticum]